MDLFPPLDSRKGGRGRQRKRNEKDNKKEYKEQESRVYVKVRVSLGKVEDTEL